MRQDSPRALRPTRRARRPRKSATAIGRALSRTTRPHHRPATAAATRTPRFATPEAAWRSPRPARPARTTPPPATGPPHVGPGPSAVSPPPSGQRTRTRYATDRPPLPSGGDVAPAIAVAHEVVGEQQAVFFRRWCPCPRPALWPAFPGFDAPAVIIDVDEHIAPGETPVAAVPPAAMYLLHDRSIEQVCESFAR